MERGYVPDQRTTGRVAETVRRTLGSLPRVPKVRRRVFDDGGAGCDSQNAKIQWTIFGKPTGGTFTSSLTINGVAETITFNWDDDATDVDTALATHSELVGSDVTVTGGPFPNATIEVEFFGTQALTNIALPTSNWGSLTGGSGVAVLTSLSQLGHA